MQLQGDVTVRPLGWSRCTSLALLQRRYLVSRERTKCAAGAACHPSTSRDKCIFLMFAMGSSIIQDFHGGDSSPYLQRAAHAGLLVALDCAGEGETPTRCREKRHPGRRPRLEAYELDADSLDTNGVVDDHRRSRKQIGGLELVGQLAAVHEDKRHKTARGEANGRGMKGELRHLDRHGKGRLGISGERGESQRHEEEEPCPGERGGEDGYSPPEPSTLH